MSHPVTEKGELTRSAIVEAAHQLFTTQGYHGTSMRQIANNAGIALGGIYNHFANKEILYCAVLDRGLQPMADAMDELLQGGASMQEMSGLPIAMTNLLAAHPHMPALFHQALSQQGAGSVQQVMDDWLDRLFARGQRTIEKSAGEQVHHRSAVIQMIAMFNLCTGYFLSQRVLDRYQLGEAASPENLREQKKLLSRIIKMFLGAKPRTDRA